MSATRTAQATVDFDCVILGAGIGGAMLALLLGRQGRRVLVVDPGPGVATRGAEILKPRGIRVLAEQGLLDTLASRGALKRHVIDYHHDGELLFSYDFAEHTQLGHFLIAPYSEIVGTIVAACADLSHVHIRFGCRMVDFGVADALLTSCTLDDGTEVRTRVLVDSGGSGAGLREFVGSERDDNRYPHALRMSTIPITDSVATRNRLYFDSRGWFAYFYPVSAEMARVFVGVPRELEEPVFDEHRIDLKRRLSTFVTQSDDALARLDEDRFTPAPVAVFTSKPYHRDNVILLGSVVFSPHPMTGQGMSYTLEDATVLAEILARAYDGRGRLEPLLQQQYEIRRSGHNDLVAYGDALARSYHDRAAYLSAFHAFRHGGDG
ncbi:monooxygenase [Nocardia sputorum]|uniref:FAD-dependent monooxygenase n=1 Tax=Nocardia sputorum TaxID=2984338 RepID=UPI00249047D6|nr:FAD-dependent monooxygenase [Nocardia sputorum]BDT90806.1 monooxygenase [Nocardia sputorum]